MSLKTKKMLKIFHPIEEQIDKLSKLVFYDSEDSTEMILLSKLVLDQLNRLAEKFECASKENADTYQDMQKKITSIIEDFCAVDFDQKVLENVKNQVDKSLFTKLIENFGLLLENLEETEVISLKQSLEECLSYVKDMGNACEIEDLQNIKELGTSIADLFCLLQLYRKNLISNLLSEKLALFCCQLYMSFSMLVQVIKEQHQMNAPNYACKKYICERMCFCFEAIINVLETPLPSVEDERLEEENNFVYRIDLVLDIIANMHIKTQEEQIKECDALWLGIEDVFAHAMSIAQVCQPYNFEAISGTCQTILTEFENLKTQLRSNPSDPTMNNLFMNTLTDALYRLERKINLSVLTLVMEVFSDPFGALKKLIKTCGSSLSASERSNTDLNVSIEEFDQLSDKSVQIGKFAIACCRDKNRAAKIKNCLASFESLEMELIPSITAFYLHPDNEEMRACVKLLTVQWQQEMNKFHATVNVIIDPVAYCEIVQDDLQQRISAMYDCLDNREDITESQVQVLVQRALSLATQITATIEDIGQENVDKQTLMIIRELKSGIYEADKASKKFLPKKATAPEQLRVINRCEIVFKIVKRLLPILSTIINNSISMNTSTSQSVKGLSKSIHKNHGLSFPSSIHGLPFDQKTMTYIRTPYSVKSYKQPLSIQPANTVPRNESDVSVLMPYIQKGRMMRTEWSIMYKTPISRKQNCTPNQLVMRNLSNVRQHLFSRDSFLNDDEIDLTAETLDLTNILENLTGLSDTLDSAMNVSTDSMGNSKANACFPVDKMKQLNRSQINKIAKKVVSFDY
ncbi:serendipity locus protein alpha-like [Copidosoma floridanum]|uniref:serendipity locus protein alpha-like n=1 Tax=Copidosoma floridanum TaxID=29053 RepID=UPI000C6FAE38|nr:serendipity locus protein alpha-like [Copidosoma floridanum]